MRHGPPEIFNTDQGAQFIATAFTDVLKRKVSTFFQQFGAFFYVTTSGSSRLTGVGMVLKLSESAKTRPRASSGLR